jgi:hypothetical protein
MGELDPVRMYRLQGTGRAYASIIHMVNRKPVETQKE